MIVVDAKFTRNEFRRIASFKQTMVSLTLAVRPLSVAKAGFFMSETGIIICPWCKTEIRSSQLEELSPSVLHARLSPLCEFVNSHIKKSAAPSRSELHQEDSVDGSAFQTSHQPHPIADSSHTSVVSKSKKKRMNKKKREAEKQGRLPPAETDVPDCARGSSSATATATPHVKDPRGTAAKQTNDEYELLLQERDSIQQSKRCKICFEKNMEIVFLPCGHLACCPDCAAVSKHCPICRTFIKATVNVMQDTM